MTRAWEDLQFWQGTTNRTLFIWEWWRLSVFQVFLIWECLHVYYEIVGMEDWTLNTIVICLIRTLNTWPGSHFLAAVLVQTTSDGSPSQALKWRTFHLWCHDRTQNVPEVGEFALGVCIFECLVLMMLLWGLKLENACVQVFRNVKDWYGGHRCVPLHRWDERNHWRTLAEWTLLFLLGFVTTPLFSTLHFLKLCSLSIGKYHHHHQH